MADGVAPRRHLLQRGAQLRAVELLDDAYGFGLQRTDKAAGLCGGGRHDHDPLALPAAGGLPGAEGRRLPVVPLASARDDLHLADEDVRFRAALPVHLHAELGAQVGDDGGGSADDKFGDLGFGDLEISDF